MWCLPLTNNNSAQSIRALADGTVTQCAVRIVACWTVTDIQIYHVCDRRVKVLPARTADCKVLYRAGTSSLCCKFHKHALVV